MGRLEKHNVFLNHRGPDLKQTFVGHLYKTLCRVGCDPFLDAKSLQKGQHTFKSIDEALIGVRVHIAIFSPRYVESKYCLNELCDMLESTKLVIPVFYNVEPEDLRWPEREGGPFVNACIKHRERGREQDLVRWKNALDKAAGITGFRLAECNNDTVKLEEKIVAAVLEELPSCPLLPTRHLVGLNESAVHVIDMLKRMGDNNVGVMGICGMGGIGKTTLATEVYNRERLRFCSRSFLKDVKKFEGFGVGDLQMKMVSDLLGEDSKKKYWNFAHWFERIRGREVLLVIDDVNERKQFDQLVPCLKDFGGGSRVLITSRDRNLLNDIMLDLSKTQRALYEVSKLNSKDSIELFLWCAFRSYTIDTIDVAFHGFVEEISGACSGLPLALEVVGGFLSDKKTLPKDEKCWKEANISLKNDMDIISSLQMSYDGLSNNADKLMFLDISCFFLGYKETFAMVVWESDDRYDTPSVSLARLIDKSLVKVDKDGCLSVHDLLQDMGRSVVRKNALGKPGKQSHLWDSLIAAKVLEKKQGSDKVLALTIAGIKDGPSCQAKNFASMKELRYLILDGCHVSGNFSKWSKELRWLRWRYFPFEHLPSKLQLASLVVLDLSFSDNLKNMWPKNFEVECEGLELLILKDCSNFEHLPTKITFSKLTTLNVQGCSSLKSLNDSISDLRQLKYLDLSRCDNLVVLPNSFLELSNLEEIDISYCKLLHILPSTLPIGLKKLRVLNMDGTTIKSLPKDFGRLENLVKFSAWGCDLEELPESFSELSNLEEVYISDCKLLHNLPLTLPIGLKKLRVLFMDGTTIKSLPKDFGRLQNLLKFYAVGSELEELPESFSELSNLEEVYISDCKLLHNLPLTLPIGLKKLRVLFMDGTTIKSLPNDFGRLQNLLKFYAVGSGLEELPESFSELSNLEEVDVSNCKLLHNLPPTLPIGLKKLRVLRMGGTLIKSLPQDFGRLQNLLKFYAVGSSLEELPESFSELSNLEEVDVSKCKLLHNLPPTLPIGLKKLRVLYMGGTTIKSLPKDFGRLENLVKFFAWGCDLEELPESFSELSNLEVVYISDCKLLHNLPPTLPIGLKKLRVLFMGGTTIKSLPKDFGRLQNLLKFYAMGSGLEELPESFSELSNLEEVDVSNCKLLHNLPPTLPIGLKKLKVLRMGGTTIKSLPNDFGRLQNLLKFYAVGSELEELPESFSELSNLEEVYISDCKLLHNLPLTLPIGLKKLRVLFMDGTTIKSLPNDFGRLQNLLKFYAVGSGLEELPESFSELSNLEEVDVSNCKLLHNLPPTLPIGLKKLRVLRMGGTLIKSLPQDFGRLQNLLKFYAVGSSLEELPESFSELSNLEKVDISNCKLVYNLPPTLPIGLKKLRVLYMDGTTIKSLPKDFGRLENLVKFSAWGCDLEELPESFSELSNLEEVCISNCKLLHNLPPTLPIGLKKLRVLFMDGTTIKSLPKDFGRLQNLLKFYAMGSGLEELPESFSELSNLEEVDVSNCKLLHNLPPTLPIGLKKLKVLRMGGTTIKSLPNDFGRLQNLLKFYAVGSELEELPESFSELSNLEKVDISDCKLLYNLPPTLPIGLKKLKVLHMGGTTIKSLPNDFGRLQNLLKFYAVGSGLEELPESFSELSNLEEVDFSNCKLLHNLPPTLPIGLKKLRVLRMGGTLIKSLPQDFGRLQNLLKFYAVGSSLEELPESFSELSNLEEVDISDCKLLHNLPPTLLFGLRKLKVLRMGGTTIKSLPLDFGRL